MLLVVLTNGHSLLVIGHALLRTNAYALLVTRYWACAMCWIKPCLMRVRACGMCARVREAASETAKSNTCA